ncbi:hypothetical protein C470_00055 [Halorubrum distributum JCM 13561]|uniref:Uncharacterized protein n=1 Tax=Halorubrum distributum JCM 13561 TaxID=1227483 RepID=M0P5C2_9EURY|nr:hypothetical protein C470_00055 [Halorubrum litoreum JCM 13561]
MKSSQSVKDEVLFLSCLEPIFRVDCITCFLRPDNEPFKQFQRFPPAIFDPALKFCLGFIESSQSLVILADLLVHTIPNSLNDLVGSFRDLVFGGFLIEFSFLEKFQKLVVDCLREWVSVVGHPELLFLVFQQSG